MAILKENNFISVIYIAESQLLWATWKAKSEQMSEEEFKTINLFYVECFEQSPLSAFLIDSREFSFSINPELQAWVATQIISRAIELGLKKTGFYGK